MESSANSAGCTATPLVPQRPLSSLSTAASDLPGHRMIKRQPSLNKISNRKFESVEIVLYRLNGGRWTKCLKVCLIITIYPTYPFMFGPYI